MAFTRRSANLHLLAGLLQWSPGPRIIVVGDSFVAPTIPARIYRGIFATWPFANGISAWQSPTVDGTFLVNRFESGSSTTSHPYDTGFATPISGATANGVRDMSNTNLDFEAGLAWPLTTSQQWFGLIFGGASEEYLSTARTPGSSDLLYQHRVTLDTTDGLVNPRIARTGQAMKARFIYRCTSDITNQQTTVEFQDATAGTSPVAMNLRTGARKRWLDGADPTLGVPMTPTLGDLNAYYLDHDWTGVDSGSVNLDIESATGTDDILSHFGFVFYDPVMRGAYIQTLGDASWSYQAHSTAAASTSGTPKRYTNDQLANWLDITTISREQRPVVMVYIAMENDLENNIRSYLQGIVDRFRSACASVGLPTPIFLLVGQMNHFIDGSQQDALAESNQSAMAGIADANPQDVAFISLYAITGGTLFDGGAAAQTWISSNGYSTFRYGTTTADLSSGLLLDGSSLHPASADAAAFMAHLLAEEIKFATPIYQPIIIPSRTKLRFPSMRAVA